MNVFFYNFFFIFFLSFIIITKTQSDANTINIVTEKDFIGPGLEYHVDNFRQITGISVNIHTFDTGDIFEEIIDDLRGGSFYDLFIYAPGWMADLVQCVNCPGIDKDINSGLMPLTTLIRESSSLNWPDVANFFRSFSSSFNGEIYAIPLDGDIHYMFYRIDILEKYNLKPPRTWEEFFIVAETLYEIEDKDWNEDGVQDFVTCIAKANEGSIQWFIYDFVAPYIQSQGTDQGLFFDTSTMNPNVNNAGFRKGIENFFRTNKYGPSNEFELGLGDTRSLYSEGRCVFTIDWGDIPLLANNSPIKEHSGTLVMPGSEQVLNPNKNSFNDNTEFVSCAENFFSDPENAYCPFAVVYDDGKIVNHSPFSAFGGWTGSIPSNINSNRQNAAFSFLSYVASPEISAIDVSIRSSGFQPYRFSHLQPELWSHFPEQPRNEMLTALERTLESKNVVTDLRIQGTDQYQDIAKQALFEYLTDSSGPNTDTIVSTIENGWNRITQNNGRRNQIIQYRQTLGLDPINFSEQVEIPKGMKITVIILASISIAISIILIIIVYIYRNVKIFRYSSPIFLVMMLLGAILVNIALILWSLDDPDTTTCTFALWFVFLGVSVFIANLFAKTFRVWYIFYRTSARMESVSFSNLKVAGVVFMFLSGLILILIVWTAVDAPTDTISESSTDDLEYYIICNSEDHGEAFFIASITYIGILLIIGVVLSYLSRKSASAFNESKYIALCLYNFLLSSIIIIAVLYSLDQQETTYLLISIFVWLSTLVAVLLLFGPKIFLTFRGKGDQVELSKFSASNARSISSSTSTSSSTAQTQTIDITPFLNKNPPWEEIIDFDQPCNQLIIRAKKN